MTEIVFHKSFPSNTPAEKIFAPIDPDHTQGNGPVSKKVANWFENMLSLKNTFLTPSCTSALEMAALVLDIQPGDEIILPSYTFVTSASAFALRGAKLVFVDVNLESGCLDVEKVEKAITDNTKAIVAVHYGGWAHDIEKLQKLATDSNIPLIEDAAQALGSKWKCEDGGSKALGSFGDMSCFSFHSTKILGCGEGGALCVNNENLLERAYLIQEKGTNRHQFLQGKVDFYDWQCLGSSFLMNEYSAAVLLDQLYHFEEIVEHRQKLWKNYFNRCHEIASEKLNGNKLLYCSPSEKNVLNGHLFYILSETAEGRKHLLDHLNKQRIRAHAHYVPLHSSPMGQKWGTTKGSMKNTQRLGECLVRLPLYPGMEESQEKILSAVSIF